MKVLAHQLIEAAAVRDGDATALVYKNRTVSYSEFWDNVAGVAGGLTALDLGRYDRVAVYLEKRIETVVALFGAAAAGAVFVPVNPLLRGHQVAHILRDCNVRVLVTSPERLAGLREELHTCSELRRIVIVGDVDAIDAPGPHDLVAWMDLESGSRRRAIAQPVDTDMAAIFYTSGSTGRPKGVVLSHRNLVAGAESVSTYIGNEPDDRILALLPLSFDAGFSQLTTAFYVGARTILMNYLLPRDVVRVCEREEVTGLTCVPPLWLKLAAESWPDPTGERLRYFANTGGHMPRPLLARLRSIFPKARPYLMYGLTEAFRSTYLDPDEVDRRPDSIGKAIPNAEVLVVRENGEECAPGEPGELVHRGALVSMGYWNAPDLTAERFRPAPGQPSGAVFEEMAVWSGDIVRKDELGFVYFVGRNDEMIKTSGYRVSPTEVEEVVFQSGLVSEVAAVGVPDEQLGQRIVLLAVPQRGLALDDEAIRAACKRALPLYMVPAEIRSVAALPRNPNGKIDRKRIQGELAATAESAADG